LIERRAFLTGLVSLVAAPAIVRAASLMPVRTPAIWRGGPVFTAWIYDPSSGQWCDARPLESPRFTGIDVNDVFTIVRHRLRLESEYLCVTEVRETREGRVRRMVRSWMPTFMGEPDI
jgi:hypothetical protein